MRWSRAVLLVAALATAGCAGGGTDPDRTITTYVALGDSYTAGAGIGSPVGDAGAGCGQTTRSYPRLVAEQLGAKLTDASCSGAATGNAFSTQALASGQPWPAQLVQLDEDTDLVTVSFGYNDLGFFFDALVSCDSSTAGSAGCTNPGESTTAAPSVLAAEVGDRLERVLEQVGKRAPRARVLVVGYPQPIPSDGSCSGLASIQGQYAAARANLALLDDAMRQAAKDADAGFVDVLGASAGHDVCAGDAAWVNGPDAIAGVALPMHPFQREQDAIAGLVVDAAQE